MPIDPATQKGNRVRLREPPGRAMPGSSPPPPSAPAAPPAPSPSRLRACPEAPRPPTPPGVTGPPLSAEAEAPGAGLVPLACASAPLSIGASPPSGKPLGPDRGPAPPS
eukprot:scaffold6725_cov117-Isochrysis_galbana.AAC.10